MKKDIRPDKRVYRVRVPASDTVEQGVYDISFPLNDRGGIILPKGTWLLGEVGDDGELKRPAVIPANSEISPHCDLPPGVHYKPGLIANECVFGPFSNFSHCDIFDSSIGQGANFNGRAKVRNSKIGHNSHIGFRKGSRFYDSQIDQISVRPGVDENKKKGKFGEFYNCQVGTVDGGKSTANVSRLTDCLLDGGVFIDVAATECVVCGNAELQGESLLNSCSINSSLQIYGPDVKLIDPTFSDGAEAIRGPEGLTIIFPANTIPPHLPDLKIGYPLTIRYAGNLPDMIPVPMMDGTMSHSPLQKLHVLEEAGVLTAGRLGYANIHTDTGEDLVSLVSIHGGGDRPIVTHQRMVVSKDQLKKIVDGCIDDV